jgi:disulfide bond formation protein DsbB
MPRYFHHMLFAIGALPLAGALLSQYGFGYAPCMLCMWQRLPYAILCALAVVNFFTPRYLKMIVLLSILLLLGNAALALFHAGVEAGWWAFESACTASGHADSLEALKAAIEHAPLVMCNQAMLSVLGLSMAGWNAVYALVMACGLAYGWRHATSHTSW